MKNIVMHYEGDVITIRAYCTGRDLHPMHITTGLNIRKSQYLLHASVRFSLQSDLTPPTHNLYSYILLITLVHIAGIFYASG